MKISNDYLKKYKLDSSSMKDIDTLIKYKLNSILKYASNLSNKELDEINTYVKDNVPKQLNNYKLINIDGNIVGCILVENKDELSTALNNPEILKSFSKRPI